jgi:capsular polysaccharide biosynthesis protein
LILDDEPRFGVHHTLTYSKGELLELRNEFLSSVRGVKPRVATKFYVRRKSGRRRILGEEELVRQLIANNFEIVDLSELEFEQQVSVFSHAEVVIGAAGAAWANLIFSSKGTRVLSLIGIDAAPWDMHEVIARDFGIKYQQLKLQHVRKEEFFYSNYLHRDVQINQNDIRKVFEWITTSSNF